MKSIEEQLNEVRELILENKRLQEKYPDRKKELQLGLESLLELEKEMMETKEEIKKLKWEKQMWRGF